MITRFYYTFRDLIDEEYTPVGFNSLFSHWSLPGFTDTTYTRSLFTDVVRGYGEEFVIYLDIEHPLWEVPSKPTIGEIQAEPEGEYYHYFMKEIRKILGWLVDSQYKYEKLIKLYDDNEANWLSKVESSSTSQFNDTPQSSNSGLDSDNYASTYTKNTNSSDPGTMIQRLTEIRNGIHNFYISWSKEFGRNFVLYN